MLEAIEDSSPLGAWALDRPGHLTTVLELPSLTRGRVMHYAIPEQLKKDFGVSGKVPATQRWTPPAPTFSLLPETGGERSAAPAGSGGCGGD